MATNYRAAYERVLADSHSEDRNRIERGATEGIKLPHIMAGRSLVVGSTPDSAFSPAAL
jgi:hypothetical protein